MKFFLFLLLPVFSSAQTFFVSGYDKYSVHKVNEKIRYEGFQLTDSAKADFIVNLLIDGSYKFTFGSSYHGYIMITDRETGKEITRTKVYGSNPAALNGYNAAYTIFNHLSKKYLPDELKKCQKKEVPSK